MKASPQLSVIIPTYNRAAHLRRTIESILNQTFSDFEILVVDDGSTDDTKEVIAQLLRKRPWQKETIRYLFQRNRGKSVALNYGLSEARGEWIAFQDSDDFWLPNKIEEQFQALQQYAPRAEACFTNARIVNDPSFQGTAFERVGIRYRDRTGTLASPCDLIDKFWIYMQSMVVHSHAMAQVGEFDPAFWTGQDEDFVFRLSLCTGLCYVNLPLLLVDSAPGRSERLTEMKNRRPFEVLELRQRRYEKWLRLSEGFSAGLHAELRHHVRQGDSHIANLLLIDRQYGGARRAVARAMRAEFTLGVASKWCLATAAPALARRIVLHRCRYEHGQGIQKAGSHTDIGDES